MNGLPDPVDQLCGSEPFRLFCESGLATPDQQLICTACGLGPDAASSDVRYSRQTNMAGHEHEALRVLTPPEQMWDQMGRPEWEAPYVWETNYF